MYGVGLYAAVRLAVVDGGMSHHEAARQYIISPPLTGIPHAGLPVKLNSRSTAQGRSLSRANRREQFLLRKLFAMARHLMSSCSQTSGGLL